MIKRCSDSYGHKLSFCVSICVFVLSRRQILPAVIRTYLGEKNHGSNMKKKKHIKTKNLTSITCAISMTSINGEPKHENMIWVDKYTVISHKCLPVNERQRNIMFVASKQTLNTSRLTMNSQCVV